MEQKDRRPSTSVGVAKSDTNLICGRNYLFDLANMGLSPSKMVIDKLSDASARASREGREDIQCILSDDDVS